MWESILSKAQASEGYDVKSDYEFALDVLATLPVFNLMQSNLVTKDVFTFRTSRVEAGVILLKHLITNATDESLHGLMHLSHMEVSSPSRAPGIPRLGQ